MGLLRVRLVPIRRILHEQLTFAHFFQRQLMLPSSEARDLQ